MQNSKLQTVPAQKPSVGLSPERRRSQTGMSMVELNVAFTILALLASMAVRLVGSRTLGN